MACKLQIIQERLAEIANTPAGKMSGNKIKIDEAIKAISNYLPKTVVDSKQEKIINKLNAGTHTINVPAAIFASLPRADGKKRLIYAGIGSRETPSNLLKEMTLIAKQLGKQGYKLQTGKTFYNKEEGADKAFSDGTTNKILFGPEAIKEGSKEWKIASEIHPNWDALTKKGPGAAKLMARNTNQVFGAKLDTPVDFVLFYAEETDGIRPKGGTGQAVVMARLKGIPTINMKDSDWKDQLEKVQNGEWVEPEEYRKVRESFEKANKTSSNKASNSSTKQTTTKSERLTDYVDIELFGEESVIERGSIDNNNVAEEKIENISKQEKIINKLNTASVTLATVQIKPKLNYKTEDTPTAVNVLRKYGKYEKTHYGNPFGTNDYGKNAEVPFQGNDAEVSQKYEDWLKGTYRQDVAPDRRKWIIEQIASGKLDGKQLMYFRDVGDNHAKRLAKLVNDKSWLAKAEIDRTDVPTGKLNTFEQTANKSEPAIITAKELVTQANDIVDKIEQCKGQ